MKPFAHGKIEIENIAAFFQREYVSRNYNVTHDKHNKITLDIAGRKFGLSFTLDETLYHSNIGSLPLNSHTTSECLKAYLGAFVTFCQVSICVLEAANDKDKFFYLDLLSFIEQVKETQYSIVQYINANGLYRKLIVIDWDTSNKIEIGITGFATGKDTFYNHKKIDTNKFVGLINSEFGHYGLNNKPVIKPEPKILPEPEPFDIVVKTSFCDLDLEFLVDIEDVKAVTDAIRVLKTKVKLK